MIERIAARRRDRGNPGEADARPAEGADPAKRLDEPAKFTPSAEGDFKGPITLPCSTRRPASARPALSTHQGRRNAKATLAISANDKAAAKEMEDLRRRHRRISAKGTVWFSTALADFEVAPPIMAGQIQRTFVDQGDSTTVTVKLDSEAPFEGKARSCLHGPPAGCHGREQEVTKDDKEVKFDVKAGPKARGRPAQTALLPVHARERRRRNDQHLRHGRRPARR